MAVWWRQAGPTPAQDRLRRKIALRRASSEPLLDAAPLVPPGGSVALELQRELGKGPLKPED